ncbi:MAG: acyl-CoA reductase-like NAD-dependent aldehyde dehydrogenase [Bermanella sp.]|jgi:acyl-CoA reductase-like NAD-dependent aldehyde dehydrogenase
MELKNFIEGEWQTPALTLAASVCDASTGEALFGQYASDADQIEQAICSAVSTHNRGEWAAQSPQDKAEALERIAMQIALSADAIARADARCTGVILSFTTVVAAICSAAFRAAATLLRQSATTRSFDGPHGAVEVERLPLGPAAVIAPWNAPSGILCHKLASALAAGCPVIIKPSEWAPESAQLIVEAIGEAGLPSGVVQLLHGDGRTGAALVGDKRIAAVSFTGGLQGGRAVAAAAARDIKPAQLELGGNNPVVVLEDADIDAAADGVVAGLITLNGQWCRALGRLLVHQSRYDALLTAVRKRLKDIRIGSALDADSVMGPVVHKAHLKHIHESIERYCSLGAEKICESLLPELKGNFIAPTLLTGLKSSDALEEIFGPVATVHTFATDDEAIAQANETPFGLAAYVFGEEQHALRLARHIRAGNIKINAVSMLNLHPLAPRPAWGLSGLGDEGVRETFEFFRGTRIIGVAGRSV